MAAGMSKSFRTCRRLNYQGINAVATIVGSDALLLALCRDVFAHDFGSKELEIAGVYARRKGPIIFQFAF